MDPVARTFSVDGDTWLTVPEWAELNNVSTRSVKRWISDGEIKPDPVQETTGKRLWRISPTAMRVEVETSAVEPFEGTSTDVANTDEDNGNDIEIEVQNYLMRMSLGEYLDKLPANIPVRLGARLLGLGIEYVKRNPDRYGIIPRGGPNQTDVMPKRIIIREAGLDRPVVVATSRD